MVVLGAIEFVLRLKDNFTRVLNKSRIQTKKTTRSITSSFKKASLAIKALWIGVGIVIVRVFKNIVKQASTAEQAMARLEQQFKNVGIATRENIEGIQILASQLQEQTGISDDAFISAAALAASYNLNAKQVGDLLPALADLTAFTTKTTGSQKDLEDSVKLMGFVLEGQVGRLKLIGITMTETQKAMIATGTRAEKLAVFLEAISANAGGVAKAMGETATGQINVFRRALDDLNQEIGESLLPTLGTGARQATRGFRFLRKVTAAFSRDMLQLGVLFEAIFTKKTFEEARAEFALLDETLVEIIAEINGVKEANLEAGETAIDSGEAQIDTFKELSDEVSKLNGQRKDLLVLIQSEGDETGILTEQLDKVNKEYGLVRERLDEVNEALDTSTEKTINFTDAIAEQFGTKGLAAELKDNGFIIEETFRKAQEAAGETTKDIDEMIRKAKERGVVILTEDDRIQKAEKKVTDESKNINEEIGINFTTAVEGSQPARDKLNEDLTKTRDLLRESAAAAGELDDTGIFDTSQ